MGRCSMISKSSQLYMETDKEKHEFDYWNNRKNIEGNLRNEHYEYFFTEHFGLNHAYYQDKIIADIGCGPRGSLEWAHMAKRRIGIDPLSDEYLKLGTSTHKMEYICAYAEDIPIEDAMCDTIFSFNSLDHVSNVEKTISEIKRITKKGGYFLLLVEVNHPPKPCEPHFLTPISLIESCSPEFICIESAVYAPTTGMYNAIQANNKFQSHLETKEIGWLSAKFLRK
jgi:ubiquinone/menaquinone biosynthesis C-methylase UbiE